MEIFQFLIVAKYFLSLIRASQGRNRSRDNWQCQSEDKSTPGSSVLDLWRATEEGMEFGELIGGKIVKNKPHFCEEEFEGITQLIF